MYKYSGQEKKYAVDDGLTYIYLMNSHLVVSPVCTAIGMVAALVKANTAIAR